MIIGSSCGLCRATGLGRSLAKCVLEDGHHLVATARDTTLFSDLVAQHGDRIRVTALDVTNSQAAETAVSLAVESFGRLDVLVNNARYGDIGSIEDTSLEDFQKQIETNLFGVIIVTKAAIPGDP